MRSVGLPLRLCSLLMTLLAVVVVANGVAAQAPAVTVQGVGFQTPESVLYDAAEDVYLVSNINGSPTAADGYGFISRIGPEGQGAPSPESQRHHGFGRRHRAPRRWWE